MAESGAIRAGRAFVEMFADDKQLQRDLKKIERRMQAWADSVRSIGMAAFGAGAAIATPLLASAKIFASTGDELAKMSDRTGLAVESLSELKYAAGQSGAGLEDLETSVRKMQKSIAEAGQGAAAPKRAIESLGLSVSDLVAMSPEQQFNAIADAISKIKDPTTRAAVAMELFGKSGTKLMPLIQGGVAGMDALREEARKLGIVMSTESAESAVVLGDAFDRLMVTGRQILVVISNAISPTMLDLATKATTASVAIAAFIRENKGIVTTAAAVAGALLGTGGGMIALGVAVRAVSSSIGLMRSVMSVAVGVVQLVTVSLSALAAASTAVQIAAGVGLVAALAGAVYWISTSGDAASKASGKVDGLRQSMESLMDAAEAFSGANAQFSRAIRLGDSSAATRAIDRQIQALDDAAAQLERVRLSGQRQIARDSVSGLLETAGIKVKTQTGVIPGSKGVFGNLVDVESVIGGIDKRIDELRDSAKNIAESAAMPALEDINADLKRQLGVLQDASLESAFARQLAQINRQYDEMSVAAEKAGQDLELVERTRQQAILNIQREYLDAQRREWADAQADFVTQARRAEESMMATKTRLADEIARLTIETTLKGDEKAKALIELDRRAAMRDAIAGGKDLDFKTLQDILKQIDTKYDLEQKAAEIARNASRANARTGGLGGTFSAFEAQRNQGGNKIDKLIDASNKSVRLLEQIRDIGRKNTGATFAP